VIVIYLFIGALETLQFPTANGGAQSLLGWAFSGIPQEKTYSAPLASTTLSVSDPQPLRGRHLMGTDALGKDTLVQALRACRTALIIGGLTSAIYIPFGTLLGILAGYYRRWVDDIIQYFYSVLIAIPDVLLLASVIMVMGKGLGTMSFALSITSWIGLCRLIRGETLRQTERPYVAAARALGQSNWNIITRHLLPNVMHLVVINFILGFSGLVIIESVLSYLSVGVPIGTPSWGSMIDGGRGDLSRTPVVWWSVTAATVAVFFLVLSLNIFGNALRRAFDPKATGSLK
jgi:peptide/nickel transport system permease protein